MTSLKMRSGTCAIGSMSNVPGGEKRTSSIVSPSISAGEKKPSAKVSHAVTLAWWNVRRTPSSGRFTQPRDPSSAKAWLGWT